MTMTTLNRAPAADLLGLGGFDVRRCPERDSRIRMGVSAPRVARSEGSGAPAIGVVAGPSLAGTKPLAHNSIGTTLGIPPSGRPLS